jgi:hypothetical protein
MKLFFPIAIALVPVLATAAIVFASYEGGFKLIRPNVSGSVAFGVVLLGAFLQVGKEIRDWREDKEKAELALKAKQAEDARAIYNLSSLCGTIDFMLQWMAAESKVAYPCQEDDIPNWFYVHNMYRTNLIGCWTSRKAYLMGRMNRNDWRQVISILESWRSQLDGEVAVLNTKNENVADKLQVIRNIQRQLDSNWGMSELTEVEMADPKIIMERVRHSLQEVINSAELIYPALKKEEYAQGRHHCAEVQSKRYPNRDYTDLVFLSGDGNRQDTTRR